MSATVCLAGDTMLGRGVAAVLASDDRTKVVADEVVDLTRSADLVLLNLECCISTRGEHWPAPGKPFFFRAPPHAVDVLVDLGVGCVTLANNHALDFGHDALLDTFRYLEGAGIAWVGAGKDVGSARRSHMLRAEDVNIEVIGVSDHPSGYAATRDRPGIAYADLRRGTPEWLLETTRASPADAVVVTPHWGPNMAPEPVPHVRNAADDLVTAGATLVAGHSAHLFHGVLGPVLFDLGDFIDDYSVDPVLRNDLGLLWLVTLEPGRITRIEAIPLKLNYCYTDIAIDEDAAWIEHRFRHACAVLGTEVSGRDGRLVVEVD